MSDQVQEGDKGIHSSFHVIPSPNYVFSRASDLHKHNTNINWYEWNPHIPHIYPHPYKMQSFCEHYGNLPYLTFPHFDSQYTHLDSSEWELTSDPSLVSRNWGSGHPSGTTAEVRAGDVTIVSHRGNEITKHGDESNPAIHIERSDNDVVKKASALNVDKKT